MKYVYIEYVYAGEVMMTTSSFHVPRRGERVMTPIEFTYDMRVEDVSWGRYNQYSTDYDYAIVQIEKIDKVESNRR